MNPDKAVAAKRRSGGRKERVFALPDANRSLVLVRKVVQDIVLRYHELMKLRTEREEVALQPNTDERVTALTARAEAMVSRLNQLAEELTHIGCVLKDWSTGLVDFPSVYQGRKIWLCWKLGEPEIRFWHEFNDGFAGRKPITPDSS
jgi:hypothetical protein